MGALDDFAGVSFASDVAILEARRDLTLAKLFTTDFSPAEQVLGRKGLIRVHSATASEFNPVSNGFNKSTSTCKEAAIDFDSFPKATFEINSLDCLKVDKDPFMRDSGQELGRALSEFIVNKVEKLLTHTDRDGVISDWVTSTATVSTLGAEIARRHWSKQHCVLILNPTEYGNLLKDLPTNVYGSSDPFQNGVIPHLFGLKAVVEGTGITTADGAGQNGCGFLVPDYAIAIGGRVAPALPETFIEHGITKDEVSGLNLGWRVTADHNTGSLFCTLGAVMAANLTKKLENGAPGYLQLVGPAA